MHQNLMKIWSLNYKLKVFYIQIYTYSHGSTAYATTMAFDIDILGYAKFLENCLNN